MLSMAHYYFEINKIISVLFIFGKIRTLLNNGSSFSTILNFYEIELRLILNIRDITNHNI